MYTVLHELLADKKGGVIFTCFGFWHFLFLGIFLACAAVLVYYTYNIEEAKRERVIGTVITGAFAVYMADFFLMPLAYGQIDIEKLPFHVCTVTCILCLLSRRNTWLRKYRISFAAVGFISNMAYLLFPAGVMWYEIHPLSYRVLQTFLFHSCMGLYGLLVLLFEAKRDDGKRYIRDLAVVCAIAIWALLGNTVYNASTEEYDHFFNWFFLMRDPFSMFPEKISPYIMPPLNVMLFFVVERLAHPVAFVLRKCLGTEENKRRENECTIWKTTPN
jgi:uncharacterized membrane protein YwaF